MAVSHKQLKNCDTKTRNIVNGYIHEAQQLFPWNENSYFIIPQLINHICLLFYWIKFAFNKEYIGKDIEFINNTTIKKINTDNHSNVAIGGSISGEVCDIFRIEYHFRMNSQRDFCPYFGFYKGAVIDS